MTELGSYRDGGSGLSALYETCFQIRQEVRRRVEMASRIEEAEDQVSELGRLHRHADGYAKYLLREKEKMDKYVQKYMKQKVEETEDLAGKLKEMQDTNIATNRELADVKKRFSLSDAYSKQLQGEKQVLEGKCSAEKKILDGLRGEVESKLGRCKRLYTEKKKLLEGAIAKIDKLNEENKKLQGGVGNISLDELELRYVHDALYFPRFIQLIVLKIVVKAQGDSWSIRRRMDGAELELKTAEYCILSDSKIARYAEICYGKIVQTIKGWVKSDVDIDLGEDDPGYSLYAAIMNYCKQDVNEPLHSYCIKELRTLVSKYTVTDSNFGDYNRTLCKGAKKIIGDLAPLFLEFRDTNDADRDHVIKNISAYHKMYIDINRPEEKVNDAACGRQYGNCGAIALAFIKYPKESIANFLVAEFLKSDPPMDIDSLVKKICDNMDGWKDPQTPQAADTVIPPEPTLPLHHDINVIIDTAVAGIFEAIKSGKKDRKQIDEVIIDKDGKRSITQTWVYPGGYKSINKLKRMSLLLHEDKRRDDKGNPLNESPMVRMIYSLIFETFNIMNEYYPGKSRLKVSFENDIIEDILKQENPTTESIKKAFIDVIIKNWSFGRPKFEYYKSGR